MKKRLMNTNDVSSIFKSFESDSRLNAWHIAIIFAIILLAIRQQRTNRIQISLSNLMAVSHISTLPTYHKYLRDLVNFGLIIYRPSYHPGNRSEIDLMVL